MERLTARARRILMKRNPGRVAALLVLLLVLPAAACGEESPRSGAEPSPSDGSSSASTAAGLVAILSESNAGGETGREGSEAAEAIDLSDAAGVDLLVGGLTGPTLAERVRARVAATAVPEGHRLVGAVVHVGCDVPTDVVVRTRGGAVLLDPVLPKGPKGKSEVQCLVPVTSVALVLVPAP